MLAKHLDDAGASAETKAGVPLARRKLAAINERLAPVLAANKLKLEQAADREELARLTKEANQNANLDSSHKNASLAELEELQLKLDAKDKAPANGIYNMAGLVGIYLLPKLVNSYFFEARLGWDWSSYIGWAFGWTTTLLLSVFGYIIPNQFDPKTDLKQRIAQNKARIALKKYIPGAAAASKKSQ